MCNGDINLHIIDVIIFQMIEMCAHVRDRWSRKILLAEELNVMEHSYMKYHTYLALALHNAVQHKDADYCKFQNLLAILSVFQDRYPQFCNLIDQ